MRSSTKVNFKQNGDGVKIARVQLSSAGINELINALERYVSFINSKLRDFEQKLGECGIKIAEKALIAASGDSDRTYMLTLEEGVPVDSTVTMYINFSGKDVLFWEFGAGIHYNNGKANPKAHEFGMGVGTYPGQRRAITPGFWWYKDEEERTHFSLGTEAAMPMYKASIEMAKRASEIAVGVFWV